MIKKWQEDILEKREILFILFLLGGYVIFSMLPNLFSIYSHFFSIPYRFIVFVFSIFILIKNRFRIKIVLKTIIILSTFWIFYFLKSYYSFNNDYYLDDFLKYENHIYLRIFVINFVPCLALLVINYQKINFKPLTILLFWIFYIALGINFFYTIFCLNYYNKISGLFSVYYISSGHYGASLVVLSLYLLFFKSKNALVSNLYLILALIFGLFAVFISAARSPLLAIFVLLFYFVLLKQKLKYLFWLLILVIFSISILYVSKQVFQFESAFVERNYVALFQGNSSGRETLFSKAYPIIKNNFLIGGRVLYQDGMYPHNIFLELLMSGGILLLTIFGLFFYPLIKKIRYFFRFSNSKFYLLPIFALWLQYFIFAQTSNSLYSNPEFWYFSCVVIAISITIYNEEIKSNDGSRNPSRDNQTI